MESLRARGGALVKREMGDLARCSEREVQAALVPRMWRKEWKAAYLAGDKAVLNLWASPKWAATDREVLN